MIKTAIKKILDKKGFKLIKKEEFLEIIQGVEGIYRKTLFPHFPLENPQRTALISSLIGTGIHEAIYLIEYLNRSLKLEGDICEFGVAQGATSALMANEIKETSKEIWLFDSFKGLPKPTDKDKLKDDIFNLGSMEKYEGSMSNPVDSVKKRLNEIKFPLSRAKIIPGYIETTIKTTNLPKKVCFAYLDFDFYEPTLIALESIDKILVPEGVMMIDDYDYFSTGIKSAVEEFLLKNKKKYDVILPESSAGHFCILKKKK